MQRVSSYGFVQKGLRLALHNRFLLARNVHDIT
jgi:hypothetical protein